MKPSPVHLTLNAATTGELSDVVQVIEKAMSSQGYELTDTEYGGLSASLRFEYERPISAPLGHRSLFPPQRLGNRNRYLTGSGLLNELEGIEPGSGYLSEKEVNRRLKEWGMSWTGSIWLVDNVQQHKAKKESFNARQNL